MFVPPLVVVVSVKSNRRKKMNYVYESRRKKVKPVFSMEDEASFGSVLWGYHRQNCTGDEEKGT